jgi:hypothetical protein
VYINPPPPFPHLCCCDWHPAQATSRYSGGKTPFDDVARIEASAARSLGAFGWDKWCVSFEGSWFVCLCPFLALQYTCCATTLTNIIFCPDHKPCRRMDAAYCSNGRHLFVFGAVRPCVSEAAYARTFSHAISTWSCSENPDIEPLGDLWMLDLATSEWTLCFQTIPHLATRGLRLAVSVRSRASPPPTRCCCILA